MANDVLSMLQQLQNKKTNTFTSLDKQIGSNNLQQMRREVIGNLLGGEIWTKWGAQQEEKPQPQKPCHPNHKPNPWQHHGGPQPRFYRPNPMNMSIYDIKNCNQTGFINRNMYSNSIFDQC